MFTHTETMRCCGTSKIDLRTPAWSLVPHRVFDSFPEFPLVLENLEKMVRYFPVRGKSGNFEQIGKVRENHPK